MVLHSQSQPVRDKGIGGGPGEGVGVGGGGGEKNRKRKKTGIRSFGKNSKRRQH